MNNLIRYRFFILFFMMTVPVYVTAQPYITTGSGSGLGQYGYLEKDAYTFATLHRNDHNNIDFLSARFWVTDNSTVNGTGAEYVYHTYNGPDGNWNCSDAVYYKQTPNYSPSNFGAEWTAGSDVYVSVFAKYCPVGSGSWGPTSPYGNIGYNQKHFQVIGIDNTAHPSVVNVVQDGNGDCSVAKVVGSFVVDPGNISGISLTRLKVRNFGTMQETLDIDINSLKVYYEASTGTEVFDGNETLPANNILWGNWGGDSQFNNFYEAANLAIPINGKTRIYITLCDLPSSFTTGRNIFLYVTNDGIDLSPSQSDNGNNRLRMDLSSVTNIFSALALNDVKLRGIPYAWGNKISVQLNHISENCRTMVLQRSTDGLRWQNLSSYPVDSRLAAYPEYYDRPVTNETLYYRVMFIMADGSRSYSYIIETNNRFAKPPGQYQFINTFDGILYLINNTNYSGNLKLQVINSEGRVVANRIVKVSRGQRIDISLPYYIAKGLYVLAASELSGDRYVFKFMR